MEHLVADFSRDNARLRYTNRSAASTVMDYIYIAGHFWMEDGPEHHTASGSVVLPGLHLRKLLLGTTAQVLHKIFNDVEYIYIAKCGV